MTTPGRANPIFEALAALFVLAVAAVSPRAGAAQYLLVQHHQPNRLIDLIEISQQSVVHRDESGTLRTVPLDQCVALFDPEASIAIRRRGLVALVDGQRIPGEALSGAAAIDRALVWSHKTLGRMQIPLKRIESVVFADGAVPPPPGDEDVVLLSNGDRLQGLITALADPLVLEVRADGQTRPVEVALDRVTAVTMVSTHQKPKGQRVWLIDGTVFDVGHVALGDDRVVRLADPPFDDGGTSSQLTLFNVAGVLFQAGQLTALADLTPVKLEGPATRFMIPGPQAVGPPMPLGARGVELRGPISATYAIPSQGTGAGTGGGGRFIADVVMPPLAREWGDCELILRDDDRIVFRAPMSAASPNTSIDVALRGSKLMIQITEGANGPIQDLLVFKRAMFIAESP